MKKVFLIALSVSVLHTLSAQKSDPYQFKVANLKDSVVYLANYYGEKLYYADTAKADKNGAFGFSRIKPEKEGKFAVVLPGPKYFEIVIAEGENIKIETDTTDLVGKLKVLESENNKLMYSYMTFLTAKRVERDTLTKQLEANDGNAAVTAPLKTRYNALNDEVLAHQRKLVEENPNLFAAREIKMSLEVEPPVELQDDRNAAYFYYKSHYFDNFDLQDDRIINTPLYHARLVNYLNKTLIQDPDTISAALDKLINKIKPGSEVYKYTVHYATYNAETSKIMGMDKVFVHMVDTYYKPGLAFWLDDEKLKTIQEKAGAKRNTLIGKVAPELILADSSEKWISTHRDIKNKYTVLFFYDPDCGHCKKETPKLVEFYNDYKGDVAVYAISSDNDDKWRAFIRKNEMNFYNVSIPAKAYADSEYATKLILSGKTTYESLKYNDTFDIFSTPKVFILDEKKVIRAKDIGVEQIAAIIDRLEEMNKVASE